MAKINGVIVSGTLVPTDTTDVYAVTDTQYGIDGHRSVADFAARDAIPEDRRRQGMLVAVQADSGGGPNIVWQLNAPPWNFDATDWTELASGAGGVEEVYIGPDDPILVQPTIELWFDTDEFPPPLPRIDTIDSIVGGGDLSQDRVLSLVNDDPLPPPLSYYGTDDLGTKGFHSLNLIADAAPPLHYYGTDVVGTQGFHPLPSGTGVINTTGSIIDGGDLATAVIQLEGDVVVANPMNYYGTNLSGTKGWHNFIGVAVPPTRRVEGINSIKDGGTLVQDVKLQLVGDMVSVPVSSYYGTDEMGNKTFHPLPPSTLPLGGIATQVLAKHSDVDFDVHWAFVTGTPLPIGGKPGDSLVKLSLVEGDMGWRTVGIPTGGIATQLLGKHSDADFDTEWFSIAGSVIPSGGQPDQVLTKVSVATDDMEWRDAAKGLPDGGVVDQVLVKLSAVNQDAGWGWINTVDPNTSIHTVYSIKGGGNLTTDRYLSLVGDEEAPPPGHFYGTDKDGKKGFHLASGLPLGGVLDQILVKLSATDGDAGWGWINAVDPNTEINTPMSVIGGGNLTTDRYITLDGDELAPPPGHFYGTDAQGKKGFYFTQGLPPGGVVDQILVKLSDTDGDAGWGWQNAVDPNTAINTPMSVIGGGNLTTDRYLTLDGDEAAPPPGRFYGTNPQGKKGFHLVGGSFPPGGVVDQILVKLSAADANVDPTAVGWGWNPAVTPNRAINTVHSIVGGGNLTTDRYLSLDGDEDAPPPGRFYGTDAQGKKGFHVAGIPPGGVIDQILVKLSAIDGDAGWGWNSAVTPNREINTVHSIIGGGNLTTDRYLSLDGDETAPLPFHFYGTDAQGKKGFHLAGGLPPGGVVEQILVKLSGKDGDAGWGWNPTVTPNRAINTVHSIIGGGNLTTDRYLSLDGDETAPPPGHFYGTDAQGKKGFYFTQGLPPGGVVEQILVKLSDKDGDAGWGWNNAVDPNTAINTPMSIIGGGNLTTDRYLTLDGDEIDPPPGRFYGTDAQGKKGFHLAGGSLPPNGFIDQVLVKVSDADANIDPTATAWGYAVHPNREINTVCSIIGGGNLTTDRYISLDGDVLTPDANHYYGTDKNKVKGFHPILPGLPPGGVIDQILVKLSDVDGDAGWGWNNAVTPDRAINTPMSIIGGGNLTTDRYLTLDGDVLTPPISSYYGTNLDGVKGFHPILPGLPPGGVIDQILVKLSDTDGDAGWGWNNAVTPDRAINTPMSIVGGGNLTTDRYLTLDGDEATPPPNYVYGTDPQGKKGFHLAGGLPPGGVIDQILVKLSDTDGDAGWGWNSAVTPDRAINTPMSIVGGGNLTTDRYLTLDGDQLTPPPNHFYGTDAQGKKGFYLAGGLPPGGVVDQILVKLSATDGDAGWGWSNAVDPNTAINTYGSIIGGGNLTTDRTISLDGDDPTPPPNYVYGTDPQGKKGFVPAGGLPPGGVVDQILVKLSDTDGDAGWGWQNATDPNVTINTPMSIIGGGNLTTDRYLTLDGDALTPPPNHFYGTDAQGKKGFHLAGGLPPGGVVDQILVKLSDTDGDAGWGWQNATDPNVTINTVHSIQGGGNLTTDRYLSLVGDEDAPPPGHFYGTDKDGKKGFHPAAGLPPGGVVDQILVKLSDTDGDAGWGWQNATDPNVSINTVHSIIGGGNLTTDRYLSLDGDEAAPPPGRFYGTDKDGKKGFHPAAGLPPGGVVDQILVKLSDTDGDAGWGWQNATDPNVTINTPMSIVGGGNLTTDRYLTLDGDVLTPPASHYYGTDKDQVKGFHPVGGGLPPGGVVDQILVKLSDKDSDAGWGWNNAVDPNTAINTPMSIVGGGNLTTDRHLTLDGDTLTPPPSSYYGTDANQVKGFHSLSATGDEVFIGPEDPLLADPSTTIELWVDEDAPSATVDEVWIGPDDPAVTVPSSELWYDTDSEEPVAAIGIMPWDTTITYLPDEKVTHPVGYPDIWEALRKTYGEEPGAAAVVDAIDFNPNSTTLPQGFSAVLAIVNPGPAPSTGLDIRLRVYTSWHPGCMVSATDAMGVSIFYLGQANNGTEDVIRWSVLTDQATQILRDVPLTAFDPATRPWLRGTADPSNNILRLFDSDDGINWAQCGADFVSPYPLVMPTLASIHIGHDNVSNVNNYIGVLSQVELHDIEGVRWTSWIARTQPTTGAGISPQTGEDYLNINTCPVTGATGTDIPWKNISNVVHWSPDSTNGMGLEGQGVTFYGGARIYKKTGAGLVIRKHSGNTHPVVENYDGSNATNIITANGVASMTAPLGSGTGLGPKFYTYGTTYGIGNEGSTFVTFFPASTKAAFRVGTTVGTEVASINASGHFAIGSITTTGDVTIGGAIKAVDSISSLGFVVISGSDPTNSSHFYVDSKDNAEDVSFTVLEGRRLDLKSCFKLKGRQGILEGGNVRGRLECYVTFGDDGEKLIFTAEQDTGGQPELGNPNGMTYAVDLWESSALVKKTNVTPLDPDKASHLIDALKPITFDRPGVRGIGAKRDPLPLKRIGIAVEDIEGSEVHVERLIRGKGDDRGYSLGGMLSVAISEIKSLRTRMAQMEDELKELRGTKGPDTGGPSTSKPPKPKPRGR